MLSMSDLTCVVAVRWSGVSSNKKCRLELALPRRVGNVRRPIRDLSPRVEIEQLDRHLSNGDARLFALLSPAPSAEPVQARRRCIVRDVARRAIALELVDAIERDVESVAALVLDDRDFDRALADEDRLDAAIDADAVLEVHDVSRRS